MRSISVGVVKIAPGGYASVESSGNGSNIHHIDNTYHPERATGHSRMFVATAASQ